MGDSSQPEPKLSTIFLELRSDLLKQQELKEESPSVEVASEENPIIIDTSTNLLDEDSDIFKKLDIPCTPSSAQEGITGKVIDIDKENMQRAITQYKYQMDYLQETNDGLILANKRLREDLQEVNEHYQELIVVSKEALKIKRSTDEQCTELKQTVKDLQQQNEELTRRVADMEDEQRRARKKAQALDGIALLAEAAKDL